MHMICKECGHIFESGEERRWTETHGLESPPYEEWSGCPICSGAYTEAGICLDCGGAFQPDAVYGGYYCEECLRDSIDYYTAYDFLNEKGYMMQFMFEKFYECPEPREVSKKLERDMRERFLRMKTDDQIRNVKDFYNLIVEFIMNDDGEIGRETYAEWRWGRNLMLAKRKCKQDAEL